MPEGIQVSGNITGSNDPNFQKWVKQYWPSEHIGNAYSAYRSAHSYQSADEGGGPAIPPDPPN